ncbi:hypothetical protein D3C76_1517840 [compost metagenome]
MPDPLSGIRRIDKERADKGRLHHADEPPKLAFLFPHPGLCRRQIDFPHDRLALLPVLRINKRVGDGGALQPEGQQRFDIVTEPFADHVDLQDDSGRR